MRSEALLEGRRIEGSDGGGGTPALQLARPQNPSPPRQANLKSTLIGADVLAVGAGWIGALVALAGVPPTLVALQWTIAAIALTLFFIRGQRLYVASVCQVRSVEIQRTLRAVGFTVVALVVAGRVLSIDVPQSLLMPGSVASFIGLIAGRSAYRSWLRAHRRSGSFVRQVVLVGDNAEAEGLGAVLTEHPELGFGVAAVVPTSTVARNPEARADAILRTVRSTGATGVLVAVTALPAAELNPVVRTLMDAGIHVHVSSGLRGIAHQRVRSTSLAYEPVLYVEPAALAAWQVGVKRAIDLVVAGTVVALSLPVLVLLALMVKLEDGGPVLFRQQRVGRNGELFSMLKLRTMCVDAEARLAALKGKNQRGDGPLFKLTSDPRITRVGRILRATSLDELPQLFNVLRGSMSLVGPRPALPSEQEAFDPELQGRTAVQPGITGLWQVEARDNPAFGPYRRLDLFYVENWSVGLDLSVLLATFFAVAARGLRTILPARSGGALAGVME